jgi:hypothetical protein
MATVFLWFGLKTTQMVFASLASKLVVTVSGGLASKPDATVFSSLASKLVATISPGLASKPVVDFLAEPQNQGDGGFLGLGLKTMCASVCWLCHKTDGGRLVRDTHRDLATCFTWK